MEGTSQLPYSEWCIVVDVPLSRIKTIFRESRVPSTAHIKLSLTILQVSNKRTPLRLHPCAAHVPTPNAPTVVR